MTSFSHLAFLYALFLTSSELSRWVLNNGLACGILAAHNGLQSKLMASSGSKKVLYASESEARMRRGTQTSFGSPQEFKRSPSIICTRKEFLGHKRIDTTLKYVQLEQVLFDKDADSFTCRVAKTPDQIRQLIEAGFEYVTEKDGLIYFRKRK